MNLRMPIVDLPPDRSSESEITDLVLDSLSGAPDPRLRIVLTSLVRHLHGFVREVGLSPEEWACAIAFLTRTGQTCSPTRQEFILLSDTLGISMLVDAVSHRSAGGATESTVLGPFYVDAPPALPLGTDISGGLEGEPLLVTGSVSSTNGEALAGATIDVWQSDAEGFYDVQKDHDAPALRARFLCDDRGRFNFRSIVPSSYPIPDDGPVGEMLRATGRHPFRPAHIHFMLSAPGHETLTTQIFVPGDPYLGSDAVFGVKTSLVGDFIRQSQPAHDGAGTPGVWRELRHDFVLTPADSASRMTGAATDRASTKMTGDHGNER